MMTANKTEDLKKIKLLLLQPPFHLKHTNDTHNRNLTIFFAILHIELNMNHQRTFPPMASNKKELFALDQAHLWHPYTDINAYEKGKGLCFDSAEGSYLFSIDGTPYLDGIASWWATSLGHSHPHIIEAIQEQAGILQHSILGNLSHPNAIHLAARLADLAPGDLNHCYFAGDGSSATEAALKMAIQYWANQGETGKTKFVSLEEGYHGDTLGAIGVGYVPTFHQHFEDNIRKSFVAPTPHRRGNTDDELDKAFTLEAFKSMEAIVRENHREIAGIILEPLCQGAAGIRIYHPEYLRQVRALCDEFGLLLIADEIAVGFGRCGEMFACDVAEIVPDILCLGKALTGGYLPMSVTIASDRIYDTFRSDANNDRTFYDGHTYCGNPITSAAALAAIDIFTSEDIIAKAEPVAAFLAQSFATLAEQPSIEYTKTLGSIAMCAITQAAGGAAFARQVTQEALNMGLFIRPLGEVLYLWPPLTTSSEELKEMVGILNLSIQLASTKKA
jgi:adenosylmethionine---8-amino-7-oxononanoate aminotransferase